MNSKFTASLGRVVTVCQNFCVILQKYNWKVNHEAKSGHENLKDIDYLKYKYREFNAVPFPINEKIISHYSNNWLLLYTHKSLLYAL
jgi:hypothetical protein